MRLLNRFREWISTSSGSAVGSAMTRRRRYVGLGLIAYVILIVGVGVLYNVPLLGQQASLRRQVESGAQRVTSMSRVMRDLEAEQERHVQLVERRQDLYRNVPGAVDLPVVMERLEALTTWSGGAVTGISYVQPRWSADDVGQLQTQAVVHGSLREVVSYAGAMKAMLPAASVERLSVRAAEQPGVVDGHMFIAVSALRNRPADAREWDLDGAWLRAGKAAEDVQIVGFPFTPAAELWASGRTAGLNLPELRLAGIARLGDEAVALIVYDDETWFARPGSRAGELQVVSIDATGVVLELDGYRFRLDTPTQMDDTDRS